ncbi:hypothetical protein QEH42_gp223 [Microbacterium phage Pumpernickel]|uniref:Uncharacterized protein n=1 Tax=Microbacterium phage Pumpernickel TaxID=2885983 RepID=A0AAE8Y7B9_9CAUD|nr:hypothetical protein QEH42_gp223 [Microbacterium phage Pumpernickel]UDL15995.1 hypothetical protein SEA_PUMPERNICKEL_245 [Microbacterium phage Pumpernickel]
MTEFEPEYGIRWTPGWKDATPVVYPMPSRDAVVMALTDISRVSIDRELSASGLGLYEPVMKLGPEEWTLIPGIDSHGDLE